MDGGPDLPSPLAPGCLKFRRDRSNSFYRAVRARFRDYLKQTRRSRYGGARLAVKGIVLGALTIGFYAATLAEPGPA